MGLVGGKGGELQGMSGDRLVDDGGEDEKGEGREERKRRMG